MPIREHACQNIDCIEYGGVIERFFHPSEDVPPLCAKCGFEMTCLASRYSVCWTGEISSKYNDHSIEGSTASGHWAMRKRGPDGELLAKPEQVFIDTFQKQTEFVKSEKLVHPKDLNTKPDHSGDEIRSHASRIQTDAEKARRGERMEVLKQAVAQVKNK